MLNDEEQAFSNELSTELDLCTIIHRVESTDGVPVPHYGDPILAQSYCVYSAQ